MAAPVGPYSPLVTAAGFLITSGQLGLDPAAEAPTLVDGGTAAQLRQALANGRALLEAHGADVTHVVKATVFLTDMGEFQAANEVWVEFFGEHRPARTAIGVAALPLGATVEVELWATAP